MKYRKKNNKNKKYTYKKRENNDVNVNEVKIQSAYFKEKKRIEK